MNVLIVNGFGKNEKEQRIFEEFVKNIKNVKIK